MFKASGRGAKKPFCINEKCANFLPEDKRGYKRKKQENGSAETTAKKSASKKTPAKKTAKKTTARKPAAKKTITRKTTAGKTGGVK
jgi:DNA topoisomerase-1